MKESAHFVAMIQERSIHREWVDRAVESPDRVDLPGDGTKHFIKMIPENGNRWLRVIVGTHETPNKLITTFFDRRLRRNP